MASVFNAFLAYKFIKIITTPWKDMDAYEYGIVDENGKQLKKTNQLKTPEERSSYTLFHRLIFNLKRILEKFPFGNSRIASYAAAFALLKEERTRSLKDVDDEVYDQLEGFLCDYVNILEDATQENLIESAPVNSIGDASHLAGLGKTPPASFAGMRIFRVKNSTYNKLLKGKKKYARWQNYIAADEASEIRDYIHKNPKKSVVLMDDSYGTMTILRRHNEI
jgi:hypothetical protein